MHVQVLVQAFTRRRPVISDYLNVYMLNAVC